MDEVLEVAELAADAGFEEAFAWLFRLVGVPLVLAGLGLWLLTDVGLLWLPAVLVVAGVVLAAVPEIPLAVLELAG
ncbi:MAG: hypothetical protein ABEH83_10590 [Halobacterium sp.]